MIITFLGGIGSGKTISAVRCIHKARYSYALTNFKLKNLKNYYRLELNDVLQKIEEKDGEKVKTSYNVNWDFWKDMRKKHPYFCIYLDEVHNLIHSRRSMSRTNILLSKWVSQVRKILNDSPHNHLYLLSQTISKIDKDFRDLGHIFIKCSTKSTQKGDLYVFNRYYEGYNNYMNGISKATEYFKASPYFRYYNHTELVDFGDVDEYL